MPATIPQVRPLSPARAEAIDRQVRTKLRDCPYSYFFNRITWDYDGKYLTIEGTVPTFYMKQMLQTVLRNVDGVQSLVNNVDVISATGLSAVHDQ